MATLNELSYNVLNIARGGLSSDDDRLNLRQIKFWVEYYRAKLIYEYSAAGKNIDPQLIQDLGLLTLTEVDKADSNVIDWDCTVKRVAIPKLIDLPNNRGLVWVGLADKQTSIILSPPDVIGVRKNLRFTGGMRRAYFIGGFLYVTDPFNEDIKYINVRGIFDRPMEVEVTGEDGTVQCIGDTDQYPMPEHYVSDIVERILRIELNILKAGNNDELNDSREQSVEQPSSR
jgi:hypothetical protein